jgi:hypothetical protein
MGLVSFKSFYESRQAHKLCLAVCCLLIAVY